MTNVLVVVGSRERAELALRALSHPQIHVEAADKEDQIVAALTGQRFDLAIVGGKIGQRGPLILCEAVRLRQEVPVLVLVGDETTEQALAEHRKQGRPDVHYIDMRQKGDAVEAGSELRREALEILHVPEDPTAASGWMSALESSAGEEVATDDVIESGGELEILEVDPDAPAPTVAQLTDEDLEFAGRIIEKTRGSDFKKAVQPLRLDGVDAAERKTVMLRERVRELERALARLAFVYAARKAQFDGAAGSIAKVDGDRQSLEGRLRELEGLRVQLEQRLTLMQGERQQVEARAQGLSAQLAQEQAARQEKERAFATMLTQAQEAFASLREQSTKAIGQYEEQLGRRNDELSQSIDRANKLAADSERLQQQQQRSTSEREQMVSERAELTVQIGQLKGELKAHEEEVARLRENRQQANEQLRTLREQLEHAASIHTQAMGRAREEFAAAEKGWLEKLEKLKSTAATFRDAYQEREGQLTDKDKSISSLGSQLEEAQQEQKRLHETHQALASVIEAERDTSELDKRLASIEEQEAHSSKRIARQLDLLDEIKDRLHKQEASLERINEALARRAEAEIANAHVSVPLQMWMWLVARPSRLATAAGTLLVLVAVAAGLGAALGGGREASARTAAPAAPEIMATDEKGSAAAKEPEASPAAAAAEATPAQEQAPEVAAAPAAAPEPSANRGGSEEERKALRKKMHGAFSKKSWAEAVKLGIELRERFELDWESEFKLADALRRGGKSDEAIAAFRAFAQKYDDNAYSDDALFNAGALLLKAGKVDEARPLLEKVAKDSKSSLAADARKLLGKKS